MNHSTPGLPVHNQLPELTQTHVHRISDAIQPPHPLSSPSPLAPNPSQHQSFPVSQFFTWGGQITGVSALASFLPKKSQGWSPSESTGWISLQSKGLSRVFSNTTVQKHQFFSAQPSSQSNSHIHTWPQEKPLALTRRTFAGKVMSLFLNMLSRLVITFLPRSKHLLISNLYYSQGENWGGMVWERHDPKIKYVVILNNWWCVWKNSVEINPGDILLEWHWISRKENAILAHYLALFT